MEEKKLDLNEVIETVKKVNEFSNAGVLSICPSEPIVSMYSETFFKVFGKREDIEERYEQDADLCPYLYSFTEQGVKFMCRSNKPVDLKELREQLRKQDV